MKIFITNLLTTFWSYKLSCKFESQAMFCFWIIKCSAFEIFEEAKQFKFEKQ